MSTVWRWADRLLVVHPIIWGLLVGAAIWFVTRSLGDASGGCVGCWIDSVGGSDEAAAIGAAGASIGGKVVKDAIDKKVGGPITSLKDMYDIASQDTPEKQAEKAFEVYKNTIMTDNAPPDSPGGQLNAAMDRFLDFATGKIDLDD